MSDTLGKVFVISTTGLIIDTLPFLGDNPEGIAWDPNNDRIFVLEENEKQVVVWDSAGYEINRFGLNIPNVVEKHGPEGLSYDSVNNQLFILNEKAPGRLYQYSMQGVVIDSIGFSVAADYSSVYSDISNDAIWILSDESEIVFLFNSGGSLVDSWLTGISKGEGLVVDRTQKIIFIVTDKDSYLCKYAWE